MTREDYIKHVSKCLRINFAPADNYKLCDLRPMCGALFESEIRGYDFFGYGDIDVIYGDIRKFYTDEVLKNNVISTAPKFITGHLALIRNVRWLRNAFRRVRGWSGFLEDDVIYGFDENIFMRVFEYPGNLSGRQKLFYDVRHPFSYKYRRKLYLQEQFTTPFVPMRWRDGTFNHPTAWFWKDGRVTDKLEGGNEYIYFHFMNFKNERYMDRAYGDRAFWSDLNTLIHTRPEDIARGFRIDRYGFHPLE